MVSVLLFATAAFPASEWRGYINDKSQPGQRYGYIESMPDGTTGTYSKLRLTCFPYQGFRLYVDEEIADRYLPSLVVVSVDKLPPLEFALYQVGTDYFFSDQDPEFWNLIAQMVAGARLELTIGNSQSHWYSLKGFTRAYSKNCDWMNGARDYLPFIRKYR